MNTKHLMPNLIKAAYAEAEMPPEQKTAMDGIFGIGVTSGVVVTLDAWSKDHDAQQAEIDALKAQNAELLAALEKAVPVVGWYESEYGGALEDDLKATIAKARGDHA